MRSSMLCSGGSSSACDAAGSGGSSRAGLAESGLKKGCCGTVGDSRPPCAGARSRIESMPEAASEKGICAGVAAGGPKPGEVA